MNTLLDLQPEEKEVNVTYGFIPAGKHEISMLTRSMLQIMIELAAQINVPEAHLADARTIPTIPKDDAIQGNLENFITINSSKDKPANTFSAVHYRDYWFWIDDRDFKSKRVFTFLMILISMTESGDTNNLPVLTIPTG